MMIYYRTHLIAEIPGLKEPGPNGRPRPVGDLKVIKDFVAKIECLYETNQAEDYEDAIERVLNELEQLSRPA